VGDLLGFKQATVEGYREVHMREISHEGLGPWNVLRGFGEGNLCEVLSTGEASSRILEKKGCTLRYCLCMVVRGFLGREAWKREDMRDDEKHLRF